MFVQEMNKHTVLAGDLNLNVLYFENNQKY